MSKARITAVLFDLDGTLLDTAPDLIHAANFALAEAGLTPCSDAQLKPHISGGAAAMLRCALNGHDYDATLFDGLLESMLSTYQNHLADRTRLFDGVEAILDALESRGLSWGIVTNKTSRFTEPLLAALNLARRPGCVISGDTTPEKKPHPLPLLEASKRLGHSPQHCVYVGDAWKDMEAGRQARMTTLAALYGYVAEDDDPLTWSADGFLNAPGDLLAWLDEGSHP